MRDNIRRDMNGVPYAHPSLELGNAEIAKVCHEISSHYDRYKDKPLIMHRTADVYNICCVYYVENRGFGDYNIFEKYYD